MYAYLGLRDYSNPKNTIIIIDGCLYNPIHLS